MATAGPWENSWTGDCGLDAAVRLRLQPVTVVDSLGRQVWVETSGKYYFFKGSQYWNKRFGESTRGPWDILPEWGEIWGPQANVDALCIRADG